MKYLFDKSTISCLLLAIVITFLGYHFTHPTSVDFTVIPNDHKEVHVSIMDGEFYVGMYGHKKECYGTDTAQVIGTCLGGWEDGAMISACNAHDIYRGDSLSSARVISLILNGVDWETVDNIYKSNLY